MAGKPKELILPNHEPPAGATATRSFLGSEVLFRKHDPPSIRSDRMLLSISRAVKQTKVKRWHRPETALCPHKSSNSALMTTAIVHSRDRIGHGLASHFR